MPTETLSDTPTAAGFVMNWKVRNWSHSNRVAGKLRLRNNPYTLTAGRITRLQYADGYSSYVPKQAPSGFDVPYGVLNAYGLQALERTCYSKIRGKLYYGSASLGVTLATVKQSREMIVKRYGFLNRRCSEIAADLFRVDGSRRYPKTRHAERLAGFHLEVIFGWVPLLADIHAAAYNVIQLDDVTEFISVAANNVGQTQSGIDEYFTRARVSYHVGARVSNPNTWLAERAGLLNPAAVVWDIVPWSFVVNMFTNMGQLVQSITDFAGLEFSNMYSTTTVGYRCVRDYGGVVNSSWSGIHQDRREAYFPMPPALTFRLPDASWGTAAMAASLFTQRFSRLAGLIRPGLAARHVHTT